MTHIKALYLKPISGLEKVVSAQFLLTSGNFFRELQLIDFGLFDKINSLDNKFETQISSLNTILSGGEKQKIAIIRTLISDGDVLIFDEPLSALDKKSKIVFQEEISKIKNKIVIIISHEELKKIKKDIVLIKLAQKKEVNEI